MLEAVEVQEEHREHAAGALRLLDRTGQMRRQEEPIRQPGQLVVMGQVIEMLLLLEQLRLHPTPHRDVAHRQGIEAAFAEIEPIAADLHLEEASAAAALPGLDDQPRRRFLELRQQRLRRAAVVAEDLRQRHRRSSSSV